MSISEFPLPDVGEGLTEAEIVSWRVKPGDTVTINQVLVEIETAKSLVELPSPFAGTVHALLVEEGQTVEVGTPIITVRGDAAGDAGDETDPGVADTASSIDSEAATEKPDEETRLERTATRWRRRTKSRRLERGLQASLAGGGVT